MNEAKSAEFKRLLKEGLQNGTFMTADKFCQKLDSLKASLKYHKMRGQYK